MLTAGGLVLAAAGVYAVFGTDDGGSKSSKRKKSKPSKASNAKVEALLKNFPYLKINKTDAEKYVKDYEKQFPRQGNKLGDGFYTKFLLSTDFFLNGAKAENPVTYLAIYDPARVPCQHPFARFD